MQTRICFVCLFEKKNDREQGGGKERERSDELIHSPNAALLPPPLTIGLCGDRARSWKLNSGVSMGGRNHYSIGNITAVSSGLHKQEAGVRTGAWEQTQAL